MRKKQIGKKLLALLVAVVLSVPNALAVSTLEASSADSSFDEWNIRDVYFTDGWINANKKGVLVEKTLSGSSFSTMVKFPYDAHANSLKHEWKISSFYALPDSVS